MSFSNDIDRFLAKKEKDIYIYIYLENQSM